MKIDYSVSIMWSQEDGAYIAHIPELPGCAIDGETREEALKNLVEVAREWIETAKEEGRPVPEPMTMEELEQAQIQAQQEFEMQIQQQIKATVEKSFLEFLGTVSTERGIGFRGDFSRVGVEVSQKEHHR